MLMSLQALLNLLISLKTVFSNNTKLVRTVSLALLARALVITFTSILLSSKAFTIMLLILVQILSVAALYV